MARILDNTPGVLSDEFGVAVGLGQIPGYEFIRIFGMNASVPASGTVDIWAEGGTQVFPSAAATLSVVSDSAEDDENEATPPGTGAFTLRVFGLDGSWNRIQEDITLTGTTPATSTQSFLRVNECYITEAGSSGSNVGIIRVSISGNVQAHVEAGEGQDHSLHYSVPANHTFTLLSYTKGVGRMAGTSDAHVLLQLRDNALADPAWRSFSDIYLYNGQEYISTTLYQQIPEKHDIRMRIASTATTQAHGAFVGYLVNT